jgi:hypothetical protein
VLPDEQLRQLSAEEKEALQKARFERLVREVRINREAARIGLGNVTGEPNTQYVWVNRAEQRIISFESMGYVIVGKDDPVTSKFRREDGTHVRGDLILMKLPKDLHEMYKWDSEKQAVSSQQQPKDEFKDWARRQGFGAWDIST